MADEIAAVMAACRDAEVTLKLRNGRILRGSLQEFDMHMNLTLKGAEDITEEQPEPLGDVLLRGDNILAISLPPAEE